MIFAQYKHAITFAVVILGLAVVVANPGKPDANDPAPTPAGQEQQTAGLTGPATTPSAAPTAADAAWFAEADADTAAAPTDNSAAEEADGGYDLPPAPAPAPAARTASRPAAPAAAPAAPTYVPPPPPPQVPPGR